MPLFTNTSMRPFTILFATKIKEAINFKQFCTNRDEGTFQFKDEWFLSFILGHCTILISRRKNFPMSNKELKNLKAKLCFEHIYGSTNLKIRIRLQVFLSFFPLKILTIQYKLHFISLTLYDLW